MTQRTHEDAPRWLAIPLFPFFIVVAVSLLIVIPPLVLFAIIKGSWGERQMLRRFRRSGRLLNWDVAQNQFAFGSGTFLVELTPKGPGWVWWTQAHFPPDCPLPIFRADDWVAALLKSREPSTTQWCEEELPRFAHEPSLVRISRRDRELLLGKMPQESVRCVPMYSLHDRRRAKRPGFPVIPKRPNDSDPVVVHPPDDPVWRLNDDQQM